MDMIWWAHWRTGNVSVIFTSFVLLFLCVDGELLHFELPQHALVMEIENADLVLQMWSWTWCFSVSEYSQMCHIILELKTSSEKVEKLCKIYTRSKNVYEIPGEWRHHQIEYFPVWDLKSGGECEIFICVHVKQCYCNIRLYMGNSSKQQLCNCITEGT